MSGNYSRARARVTARNCQKLRGRGNGLYKSNLGKPRHFWRGDWEGERESLAPVGAATSPQVKREEPRGWQLQKLINNNRFLCLLYKAHTTEAGGAERQQGPGGMGSPWGGGNGVKRHRTWGDKMVRVQHWGPRGCSGLCAVGALCPTESSRKSAWLHPIQESQGQPSCRPCATLPAQLGLLAAPTHQPPAGPLSPHSIISPSATTSRGTISRYVPVSHIEVHIHLTQTCILQIGVHEEWVLFSE